MLRQATNEYPPPLPHHRLAVVLHGMESKEVCNYLRLFVRFFCRVGRWASLAVYVGLPVQDSDLRYRSKLPWQVVVASYRGKVPFEVYRSNLILPGQLALKNLVCRL